MPVEPTGVEGIPYKKLRDMISESAAFRTWVGAANVTEALDRIHYHGFKAPVTKLRPYALVGPSTVDGFSGRKIAGGSKNTYGVIYRLLMNLAEDVDNEQDVNDQRTTFFNTTGAIFVEVMALAGADEWLDIEGWDRPEGGMLTGKNDRQDHPVMIDSLYEFEFSGQALE